MLDYLRETLINGVGTIVLVVGGVFLLLNFHTDNRSTETVNLSDANLSSALLFFVNSREVQNLEPLQLEANLRLFYVMLHSLLISTNQK